MHRHDLAPCEALADFSVAQGRGTIVGRHRGPSAGQINAILTGGSDQGHTVPAWVRGHCGRPGIRNGKKAAYDILLRAAQPDVRSPVINGSVSFSLLRRAPVGTSADKLDAAPSGFTVRSRLHSCCAR